MNRGIVILLVRALIWALIAEAIFASAVYGFRLRRWTWDITEPIRFRDDIHNGWFWGLSASGPEGYLNQYEKMAIQTPPSRRFLDYAPLRLFVMSRWGAWLWKHHPPDAGSSLRDSWEPEYEYTAPVLHFNAAMDGLAAVCAFFLTLIWVRRGSDAAKPRHFHGVWQGLIAALLLWFSPAIVLSAHGWPTWNSWIVPFYLLAALLATLDCWFWAGVAVAVGAMFKGQQLTVLPVFFLWPMFQKKWGGVGRFIAGLTIAFAAIASPWLLSYLPPDKLAAVRQFQQATYWDDYPIDLFAIPRIIDWAAIGWIAYLAFSLTAVRPLAQRFIGQRKWWKAIPAAIIVLAVAWPCFLPGNRAQWMLGVALAVALAAAALYLPRQCLRYTLAIAIGAALLLCMDLFHGSTAWWFCGFHYGTIHWPWMIMGDTSNLPGIFQLRWGWPQDVSEIAFVLPAVKHLWPETEVTTKLLFNTIFTAMLLLSAVGVALQARRRDRRMLVALATPWLMFFLLPVQIHERYLLFAAAVSAICIGQSIGMTLLGGFLTFVSWIMMLHVMLEHGNLDLFSDRLHAQFPSICSLNSAQTMLNYIQGTHPDIGWGVMVAGLVFLWVSLTPTPARSAPPTLQRCIAQYGC